MKTIYKISSIIILLVALNSCEKVIDLELKDAKQQIVVDANIYNGAGNNLVKLTKSSNFYDSNNFETIKGANVIVTSSTGEIYVLKEIEDGVYNNYALDGTILTKYDLNISFDGKTITSSSTMPELISLDSLTTEINDGFGGPGGGQSDKDTLYKVFVNFTDPINEKNYYRIKVWINGFCTNNIYVIDDELFNGIATEMPLRNEWFVKGDVVTVNLISIDKANYEYYRLLDENDMGATTTSVGNPVSNVNGEDVIGVFGASAYDSKTITIK